MQNLIEDVVTALDKLSAHVKEKGRKIEYDVEHIGGVYPVDVPITTAYYYAKQARRAMIRLMENEEFILIQKEGIEAERVYKVEVEFARRELDLGP